MHTAIHILQHNQQRLCKWWPARDGTISFIFLCRFLRKYHIIGWCTFWDWRPYGRSRIRHWLRTSVKTFCGTTSCCQPSANLWCVPSVTAVSTPMIHTLPLDILPQYSVPRFSTPGYPWYTLAPWMDTPWILYRPIFDPMDTLPSEFPTTGKVLVPGIQLKELGTRTRNAPPWTDKHLWKHNPPLQSVNCQINHKNNLTLCPSNHHRFYAFQFFLRHDFIR